MGGYLQTMLRGLVAGTLCGSWATPLSKPPQIVRAAEQDPAQNVASKAEPLWKKKYSAEAPDAPASEPQEPALLGTLLHTHTGERIALTETTPSDERFDSLLADRATNDQTHFDPRLLGLLRSLAKKFPACRIELVSGYRSAKLNEQMRKKGHHVASHSQHSLGHAVDFRIVPLGDEKGITPKALEKEIRGLGWDGGVGKYSGKGDWFVHADVGRNRKWGN
jgi:uncharacterized protein YcbK (DUF882 family)